VASLGCIYYALFVTLPTTGLVSGRPRQQVELATASGSINDASVFEDALRGPVRCLCVAARGATSSSALCPCPSLSSKLCRYPSARRRARARRSEGFFASQEQGLRHLPRTMVHRRSQKVDVILFENLYLPRDLELGLPKDDVPV